jgi:uncharacterized protein YaaN involved in tellurite resistance
LTPNPGRIGSLLRRKNLKLTHAIQLFERGVAYFKSLRQSSSNFNFKGINMSHVLAEKNRIKHETLPALFAEPSRIGEYGSSGDVAAHMQELSALMEKGAVGRLAATIAKILSKMADASPQKITKKAGWLSRVLGGELETHARYHIARDSFESLIEEAQGQAQGVRDTIGALDRLIDSHHADVQVLDCHIQAAREYMTENQQAGVAVAGSVEFDRPRERLARKVANLATLQASHELGVSQMKLSKAQAVDLLDRFGETVTVLVPVWRQHTLTLITTKAISPELMTQASLAHNALMKSLSLSLTEYK